MLGVQPRGDLAAAQRDGGGVHLQVGPVLVQDELVVLDSAPALPPAAVGEHVQVACNESGRQPERREAPEEGMNQAACNESGRQPPGRDAPEAATRRERTPRAAQLSAGSWGREEPPPRVGWSHQLWGPGQLRPPRSPTLRTA